MLGQLVTLDIPASLPQDWVGQSYDEDRGAFRHNQAEPNFIFSFHL